MLSQKNIMLRVTLDGKKYSSASGGAYAVILAVQKDPCPQEPFHSKVTSLRTPGHAVTTDQRET